MLYPQCAPLQIFGLSLYTNFIPDRKGTFGLDEVPPKQEPLASRRDAQDPRPPPQPDEKIRPSNPLISSSPPTSPSKMNLKMHPTHPKNNGVPPIRNRSSLARPTWPPKTPHPLLRNQQQATFQMSQPKSFCEASRILTSNTPPSIDTSRSQDAFAKTTHATHPTRSADTNQSSATRPLCGGACSQPRSEPKSTVPTAASIGSR